MDDNVENSEDIADTDFKEKYKTLKRKLKDLIYENEYLHETLRDNHKKFLKATRDRNFLLERLSQYEPADLTSSDTDENRSSDEDMRITKRIKKAKPVRSSSLAPVPTTVKQNVKKIRKKKSSVTMVPPEGINIDDVILDNEANKYGESSIKSVMSNKQCITVTPEMFPDDASVDE